MVLQQQAGMHEGDLVKEVDGKPISNWEEFVEIIQDSPGIPLQFVVERDGTLETLAITPATIKEKRSRIRPDRRI